MRSFAQRAAAHLKGSTRLNIRVHEAAHAVNGGVAQPFAQGNHLFKLHKRVRVAPRHEIQIAEAADGARQRAR